MEQHSSSASKQYEADRFTILLVEDNFLNRRMVKKALEKKLPADIIHRKKKGFNMPVAHWLLNDLKPLMDDMLSDSYLKSDFQDQEFKAREYCFNLCKVYIKALLLELTHKSKSLEYKAVLNHWVQSQKISNPERLEIQNGSYVISGF